MTTCIIRRATAAERKGITCNEPNIKMAGSEMADR